MASQEVSEGTNRRVLVASICVGCGTIIARIGARWFKIRKLPFVADDISMYIALASLSIMCSLYLSILPTLYRDLGVQAGLQAPWANMQADLTAMLKKFFAIQLFFWLTLWAVKCSILFMIRRLIVGLTTYNRIWWAVMVFTIFTFIGCVVSQFTSCSSFHAWFRAGQCLTARDTTAKAASLWYSLAVDLLTDLMIMIITVQVLRTLRISKLQKFSVGIVFFVGVITMVFAIVRVVSLDSSISSGQVSTTWLILWAAVEGMVAIIVGSLPAFAISIKGRVEASLHPNSSKLNSPQKSNSNTLSSSKPSDPITPSFSSPRGRQNSLWMDDVEGIPTLSDDEIGRRQSVGDGSIMVTHSLSQRWHNVGDEEDLETGHIVGY